VLHPKGNHPRESLTTRAAVVTPREVGAEQNTMTIVMMPSEFVSTAGRGCQAGDGKDLMRS